jgi:hypothetical protein
VYVLTALGIDEKEARGMLVHAATVSKVLPDVRGAVRGERSQPTLVALLVALKVPVHAGSRGVPALETAYDETASRLPACIGSFNAAFVAKE